MWERNDGGFSLDVVGVVSLNAVCRIHLEEQRLMDRCVERKFVCLKLPCFSAPRSFSVSVAMNTDASSGRCRPSNKAGSAETFYGNLMTRA